MSTEPTFQALGIDVSHYQQAVDWEMVKAAGISFAIVKATEGTGFIDPTFDDNWRGMKAAGIVRGVYHFFHLEDLPNLTEPEKQALKAALGGS